MDFALLLSRLDDDALQQLLGPSTIRLLFQLDASLTRPSGLRKLLTRLWPPSALLRDAKKRALLLEYLRPEEAYHLRWVLGIGELLDDYRALKNMRIRQGSERERALFHFFGLEVPSATVTERLGTAILVKGSYQLFPHQRRAAHEVQTKLEKQPHRVLLHMPTGAGKTRTAMSIIVDHLRTHEPTVVVWLAYSEELCLQAVAEFEKAWSHLGNREVIAYRFWGQHDLVLEEVHDGVLVAGLAKLYNLLKRQLQALGTLGDRTSLVIIDEAHMAVAETYKLVLDSLLVPFPETRLLGLTATPGRTWADIDEDERLSRFFARQKVTLQVEGYDNPVRYLIDQGYLAAVTFRSLSSEGAFTLSGADRKRIAEALDIPQDILNRLAEDEQRNLLIITELEELTERHRRILFFATTVQHAELFAAVLQARGIHAHVVTGTTPIEQRTRIIEDFRNDEDTSKILCNYGVLTTGFDAPQTSAALIARPTKSLVLYSQMVGRAMRGPRAGGHAHAEIVTVIDQGLPGFGDMAEAFLNWEDVWDG